MSTFGSGSEVSPLFMVILVLWLGGYLFYRAYVFLYRPEQLAEERRMRHEKEMAAAAERRAKAGRVAGGILGGIAKAILGAVIKGRPHH